MSSPIPSQVALTQIVNGTLADGSVVQANDAAIQAAVNELITALSNGTAGQLLQAVDGSDVVWSNTLSSITMSGNLLSVHGSGSIGGDGTDSGYVISDTGLTGLLSVVAKNSGNTFLTSTVAGDATDYRFTINADGTIKWGPGSGARDTTLARSAAGVVKISNVIRSPKVTLTYGTTVTPDASQGNFQAVTVTNTSPWTLATPLNPPASNETQQLVIEIIYNSTNNANGAVTASNAYLTGNTPGPTLIAANSIPTGWHSVNRFHWDGGQWVG